LLPPFSLFHYYFFRLFLWKSILTIKLISMNKKAANIIEYILCILISIGFITAIVFAEIQSEKQTNQKEDVIAQQMGCDFNLKSYVAKADENQSIINYLYEQDMQGDIHLDKQTIFWLGRIN
jgi:hypothetical protein